MSVLHGLDYRQTAKTESSIDYVLNFQVAEAQRGETSIIQKCKTTSFKKKENNILFSFLGLVMISHSYNHNNHNSDNLKCHNLTSSNNPSI